VINSREYYSARLTAEREAVDKASCEEARAAHQALDDHYAGLLLAIPDGPQRPAMELVRDPEARH
jgi:hypothetical protein